MTQFLFEEVDQQILLTAALYFCVHAFPCPDGDVTRGAEMVIETMQMRLDEAGEFAAGTLAGGIMVVGDRRFVCRMQQAWEILGQDGRDCMIASRGIACCHAHVEFLLCSLENTDDPKNFGRAADALTHLANEAEVSGVIDTRRTVPVSSNPQNPITIVERWSVQDYGEQIHQRLSALAAREGEDHDKVMPAVRERWPRA